MTKIIVGSFIFAFIAITIILIFVIIGMVEQNEEIVNCLDISKIKNYSYQLHHCNIPEYQNYTYLSLNDNCINGPSSENFNFDFYKECKKKYCSNDFNFDRSCVPIECIDYISVKIQKYHKVKNISYNKCFNYTHNNVMKKCIGFECNYIPLIFSIVFIIIAFILYIIIISMLYPFFKKCIDSYKQNKELKYLLDQTYNYYSEL